ncbi:MAG TPA: primosomal protein N' [Gammaproteobacteria bacterium]|nr:primosomal protein N' [Gammaproteobacteria bacterium]
MPNSPHILHIAINKPVRHCFDYLLPDDIDAANLQPGMRVQVPFGKQQALGILLKVDRKPCLPLEKLKPATWILDTEALLPPTLLALCEWAARYYHHPIGEVVLGTLPVRLRSERSQVRKTNLIYRISSDSPALDATSFKRSHRQMALWILLRDNPQGLSLNQIKEAGFQSAILKSLLQKNWVETTESIAPPATITPENQQQIAELPLALGTYQKEALSAITASIGFQAFLLEGITGSGKTEVYLQAIAHYLAQGKQALVLVPEIGLTPQTIARFERRFTSKVVALHSGLTDNERLDAWLKAKSGAARIIIGTRSAIFIAMQNPGIIIIDEEHDASFKQQSGFRYSARDLALVRGRLEAVPVVLGTATPSLESLHNARIGRFVRLNLPERAGNALVPIFNVIDIRNQYLEEGLSAQLLQAISQHIAQGNQVLLFLNRRGFAPVLLCHSCGWIAECRRCDARLTLHQRPARLICHHCTQVYPMPRHCAQCSNSQLFGIGLGTERLEEALKRHFPTTPVLRIDRDTVRGKDAMKKTLAIIHQGAASILLGTQMLAKGHHFPNVTLVGIIDVDGGLYSTDFRASERMGQVIIQVAGRAGRENKPGQVLLQTHHPKHPLLQALLMEGFPAFANLLLQDRSSAAWPPFSYLALLRAEAKHPQAPLRFLQEVRAIATRFNDARIKILGPIPAPMERKAGHFRALLLLQAQGRPALQQWLETCMRELETLKMRRKVRWSLDVDPVEMF